MKWSVEVVDTSGDPITVELDTDTNEVTIIVTSIFRESGKGLRKRVVPVRIMTKMTPDKFRSILNVVEGWPL